VNIDWSKQHCGVHQAQTWQMIKFMPDLKELITTTFPDKMSDFIWDVKVHMLMPNQYPGIPNWHFDNIPRINNRQDFELVRIDLPMYLWVSGAPLTEFRRNGRTWFIEPEEWVKFHQNDEHRCCLSNDFTWRGFIRATHKDIFLKCPKNEDVLRRHSQVYLDAANFSW
jgi:hypothetical protein